MYVSVCLLLYQCLNRHIFMQRLQICMDPIIVFTHVRGTLDIFNIGYFRRLPPQQQFETLEDGEMGV